MLVNARRRIVIIQLRYTRTVWYEWTGDWCQGPSPRAYMLQDFVTSKSWSRVIAEGDKQMMLVVLVPGPVDVLYSGLNDGVSLLVSLVYSLSVRLIRQKRMVEENNRSAVFGTKYKRKREVLSVQSPSTRPSLV